MSCPAFNQPRSNTIKKAQLTFTSHYYDAYTLSFSFTVPDRLVLTVPEYQVVEVTEGGEARLFCDATSPVTPAFMWLFNRDGQSPLRMVPGQRRDGIAGKKKTSINDTRLF